MRRLLILVEGETEETFVNEVLAPHLFVRLLKGRLETHGKRPSPQPPRRRARLARGPIPLSDEATFKQNSLAFEVRLTHPRTSTILPIHTRLSESRT